MQAFVVDDDALIACFAEDITEEIATEIAKRQPLRTVFKDAAFGSDALKINIEQLFKHHSPATELRCL